MKWIIALGFLLNLGHPAHCEDASVGDSIAYGTGHALGVPTYARVGASSCEILRTMPRQHFDHLVVSAGINDPPGPCVRAIFSAINASRVVVILPAPINSARASVILAARDHGHATLSYSCGKHGCSKHNFHPASYAVVAHAVRAIWYGH